MYFIHALFVVDFQPPKKIKVKDLVFQQIQEMLYLRK